VSTLIRSHAEAVRGWLGVDGPAGSDAAVPGPPHPVAVWWSTHVVAADAAVAVLVAVAVVPQISFHWRSGDPATPAYVLLSVLLIAPLAWRRRAPLRVFCGVAVVGLAQLVIGVALAADVVVLITLTTVAAIYPLRTALVAAGVVELGALGAALRWPHGLRPSEMFVVLTVFVIACVTSGAYVRSRRRAIAMLREHAEHLRRERRQQTQLAVVEERTRIARDMHDVVAHSLTVVVTLAVGARGRASTEPDRVDRVVGLIEQTGRSALGDARAAIGTLRADASLQPIPTLEGVEQLVRALADTSLPARLRTAGDLERVPPAIGIALYRVTQEAIANAVKHAAGASAISVEVTVGHDRAEVEILDDGRTGAVIDEVRRDAGGLGLIGMRERIDQHGGTFVAGPVPTGGWRVLARVPFAAGARTEEAR
jgi:signal transduction histidine kinase